jgi:hypothetical protein
MEQKKRIEDLYATKKECIREILILKSAFSVVNQMFVQEIKNAEMLNNHWFVGQLCCGNPLNLKDPEGINNFITGLMDPFKDKEEYEKKRAEAQRKEQKRLERESSNVVCWPFFYWRASNNTNTNSVINESKLAEIPKQTTRRPNSEHRFSPSIKSSY